MKVQYNHRCVLTLSFNSCLQVAVRESCRWQRWRLSTWRWRAGHVTPASRAGGPFPAAPLMSEASSAWGASSNRGRITSTPDLTLSVPWRSMIWIKVSHSLLSSWLHFHLIMVQRGSPSLFEFFFLHHWVFPGHKTLGNQCKSKVYFRLACERSNIHRGNSFLDYTRKERICFVCSPQPLLVGFHMMYAIPPRSSLTGARTWSVLRS